MNSIHNKYISKVLVFAVVLACQSVAMAAEVAPNAAASAHASSESMHGQHGGHAGMAGNEKMNARDREWTTYPILKTRAGGESRESLSVTVLQKNILADYIEAHTSDLSDPSARRHLQFTLSGATLDRIESGLQWLAAREEREGVVRVASTVYFRGSGKNPTDMFMQQKHELEIIPRPFPREHSRYRANEEWKFMLHFKGMPLANHKVVLETQNGTKTDLSSDTQGEVTVHIPDDFKKADEQKSSGAHQHGRRSSGFVLATEHVDGGKTYLTGFNSSYGPDAYDQRSLAFGLGFTLLGMVGAVPLLQHRKASKKKAAAQSGADTSVATEKKSEEA